MSPGLCREERRENCEYPKCECFASLRRGERSGDSGALSEKTVVDRDAIIEECAKVCDTAVDQCDERLDSTFQSEYMRGCRNEADSLGTAIRALKNAAPAGAKGDANAAASVPSTPARPAGDCFDKKESDALPQDWKDLFEMYRRMGLPDAWLYQQIEAHSRRADSRVTNTQNIEALIGRMHESVMDTEAAGRPEGSLYDNWIELRNAIARSATTQPISGVRLLKAMREQRDELATLLRDIVDRHLLPAGTDIRARALLERVPTYEQQLRNIAEGIGMTYEELMAAMALHKTETDRNSPKE